MKKNVKGLIGEKSPAISLENINEINASLTEEFVSGTLDEYFKILDEYIKKKELLNMTTATVAQKSNFPELTIKRFENLQCIPKITNLIKILNAVELNLAVVPIEEKNA